jgi:glutathione S-transferase
LSGRPSLAKPWVTVALAEGSALLPVERLARTRVLSWLCFEQTNVDGVISRARFRRLFPDVIPTRTEEFDVWWREGKRALGVLDEHLREREYLVEGRLTIADLALYSYVHKAHEGGFDLAPFRALPAWFGRIEARPAHLPIDVLPA